MQRAVAGDCRVRGLPARDRALVGTRYRASLLREAGRISIDDRGGAPLCTALHTLIMGSRSNRTLYGNPVVHDQLERQPSIRDTKAAAHQGAASVASALVRRPIERTRVTAATCCAAVNEATTRQRRRAQGAAASGHLESREHVVVAGLLHCRCGRPGRSAAGDSLRGRTLARSNDDGQLLGRHRDGAGGGRPRESSRGQAFAWRQETAPSRCRPSDGPRPNGSAGENDRPWERFRESSGVRRSSPNASAALSARGGRNRGRRHRAGEGTHDIDAGG